MDALLKAHAIMRGGLQHAPRNDNGRLQPAAEGTQVTNTSCEYRAGRCAAQDLPLLTHDRKRLATLTAMAALKGAIVSSIPNDAGRHQLIVTQGALTKRLESLDELEQLLVRIPEHPPNPAAAPPPDPDRERLAQLQALAAPPGIQVGRRLGTDGRVVFFVGRWSFVKELPDLDAVERFLAVQGVRE